MVRKELVVEEVQKIMYTLPRIRNMAIVAHVDHGKCVSGDSRLTLADGDVVEARELFERAREGCTVVRENSNEIVYDVSQKNIRVFSLNKITGRIEAKPVSHAWKLKGGKLLKVSLRNGFSISTTPEHKYIVFERMSFVEKTASELEHGDRIVCARELEVSPSLDLKEEIIRKISSKPFYVRLKPAFARELGEKIPARGFEKMRGELGLHRAALKANIKEGRFLVSDALKLCCIFSIPVRVLYDNVETLFYRRGGRRSKNSKEMRLPTDFRQFFYLAGLLVGDGSEDKLVVGKPELGRVFAEICESLGIKPFYRDYSYRTPEISAGCQTLVELLNSLFDYPLKKKSHNVRVSSFVSRAPKELSAAFMRGYFDCDGGVERSRGAISITSASERMIRDLQLLLLRFGCLSSADKNTLYISGEAAKNFVEHIGFGVKEKMEKALALSEKAVGSSSLDIIPLDKQKMTLLRGSVPMNRISNHYYQYESGMTNPTLKSFDSLVGALEERGAEVAELKRISSGELAFLEVKSIEEARGEVVFDFSVPDNHNFVSEGMVIHNTTLTDSLVARAGLISKELAGQQRMLDFDEQEQARGITIKAAYISLGFNYEGTDYLINLIDTPGHVDFGGHVTRAMRAVDGIVLVMDSVEGIMPQTETVLRQSLKEKAKPVLFINKIDRLINELKLGPQEMQDRLIKLITGVNKLIDQYASPDVKEQWKLSVEKGNVAFGSAFNKWAISFPFMKKSGLTFKDIYNYCQKGEHKTLTEKMPIDEVILEMAVKHLPNPEDAQKYRVPVIWKGDITSDTGKMMTACDRSGKVNMVIFGVAVDEHAGEVGIGRVFSGTVKKGTELFLASKQKSEKVQQVSVYMGPDRVLVEEVPAGNIAGIIGLHDLYVGETASEGEIEPFEQIKHYSEPVVTKSIEAKNTKDLVKLVEVLRQIAKEDPTIKIEINQETGEHLISGMGELHLEIIEYKIKNEKKVDIETSRPIVVYKETIAVGAGPVEGKSPNKHSKFKVIVEPLEEGVKKAIFDGEIPEGKPKGKTLVETLVKAGLPREEAKNLKDIKNCCLFLDVTKGIQYMDEVMELLIEGFEDAVSSGPLAREKMTGIKVKVTDATIHEDPVHRGPAQIIPAIRRPIYAASLIAGVMLLEPKQKLLVQAPQNYLPAIINQIQGRRGQVLEIQQEGEVTTVTGKVPVAEMFGFSNDMRSATQGRAIWYTEYAGYEKLSKDLQAQIVPQIRERKGEPKEPPTPEFFMD